jgi:hypothetical protein
MFQSQALSASDLNRSGRSLSVDSGSQLIDASVNKRRDLAGSVPGKLQEAADEDNEDEDDADPAAGEPPARSQSGDVAASAAAAIAALSAVSTKSAALAGATSEAEATDANASPSTSVRFAPTNASVKEASTKAATSMKASTSQRSAGPVDNAPDGGEGADSIAVEPLSDSLDKLLDQSGSAAETVEASDGVPVVQGNNGSAASSRSQSLVSAKSAKSASSKPAPTGEAADRGPDTGVDAVPLVEAPDADVDLPLLLPSHPQMQSQGPATGRRVSFPDNVVAPKSADVSVSASASASVDSPADAAPSAQSIKRQTSSAAPALGMFRQSRKDGASPERAGGGDSSNNSSASNLRSNSNLTSIRKSLIRFSGTAAATPPPPLPEVYVVFKWNNNVEVGRTGRTGRARRDGSDAYWNDDPTFYLKLPVLEADKNGVTPQPQLTIELWEDHTNVGVLAPGPAGFGASFRDGGGRHASPLRQQESVTNMEAPKKRRGSLISALLKGTKNDNPDILIGSMWLEGEELDNFLSTSRIRLP